MKILLIRHGRTAWNKELVFRGGADVPLDRAGVSQASSLAARLRRVRLAAVYSGPLSRARRTAELAAAPHRLPVTVLPGLDDMRFGAWEGRPLADVERTQPQRFSCWQREPWNLRIPGGTTLRQVEKRAWRTLRAIVAQHRTDDAVAVVTHRVVLKLLVLRMLGAGARGFWRVALDPCGLTVADWDGSRFMLERLNDTGHLREQSGRDF
ncbi:MAG: histidine phosphatase family protein [Candidatus Edwardsbacteria bacterium]|jgi:broad specificity phosphatase PhoE|nr:histidine phosphatase family protein [Candidatus Edwardsbacteria bacterium]